MSLVGRKVKITNNYENRGGHIALIKEDNTEKCYFEAELEDGKIIRPNKPGSGFMKQCELLPEEVQFVLPDKWYIDRGHSNEITKWFRDKFGVQYSFSDHPRGDYLCIPGIDDSTLPHSITKKNELEEKGYKEITFEQFKEHVLAVKGFVLPEKWCIKRDKGNYKTVNRFFNDGCEGKPYIDNDGYMHFPNTANFKGFKTANHNFSVIQGGYKEITFEQFKTHVLEQKNMTKKIVGYNLVKKQYEDSVRAITGSSWWNNNATTNLATRGWNFSYVEGVNRPGDVSIYGALAQAGVIDLWFEPVYGEASTMLNIRGVEVNIHASGRIDISREAQHTEIAVIKALIDDYTLIEARVIGDTWKTSLDEEVAFIRIGCLNENFLVSIKDLRSITTAYNLISNG